MEKASSRTVWSGFVRATRWVAKAALVALALYIFFPPFWDAAFAANLEALHKAPYIAADRARGLWHAIVDGLSGGGPGTQTANRLR